MLTDEQKAKIIALAKQLKEGGDRALTDEQKAEVMSRLLEAWKKWPEQRLGQFLWNVAADMLWFVEDNVLAEAAEVWPEKWERP